jgi:hypothetical protein
LSSTSNNLLPAEVSHERVLHRLAGKQADVELARDCRGDVLAHVKRRQRHERGPVAQLGRERARQLNRQPRLADPRRTHDRDQPYRRITDYLTQGGEFDVPAQRRGRREWDAGLTAAAPLRHPRCGRSVCFRYLSAKRGILREDRLVELA